MKTKTIAVMLVLMVTALATTAQADLLIEESFETDLSGGTGLGAWTTNNVDRWAHIWYTGDGTIAGTPDGDAFGLAQSGGFLRRENALGSAGISSAIDGSVDLVTPGTVYFSALIELNNGLDTNHNAALILGSDPLDVPSGGNTAELYPMMTVGEGIGFGLDGFSVHAYVYDGGVGTTSAGSIAASNGSTLMIVGKITWGALDTLDLYNITDVSAPLPAAFATISGDLDESAFDTLAIADKRQTGIDEIRFGTELADVGVSGPATNFPSIVLNIEDVVRYPGADVVFALEYSSSSAITGNQWFWSDDDGATFTELSDNTSHPSGSGSTVFISLDEGASPKTSVLTLSGFDAADVGLYYCTLTNSEGSTDSFTASLTVGAWDYIIDDFEDYIDTDDFLQKWSDGSSNATGATAALTLQAENQVMQIDYDNTSGPNYSETQYDVPYGIWDENAAMVGLSMLVYGDASNAQEPFYVALEDGTGNFGLLFNGIDTKDTIDLTLPAWQELNVPLQDFVDQGVDISDIQWLYIGFGNPDTPEAGGQGQVLLDSIRLYPSRCVEQYKPIADINDDCVVDLQDFAEFAEQWLD